jgi:glycosyltransferase involved in cell wall biosynthesis
LEKQPINQLSLVMPIHGAAPFLSEAIESVYKSQDVKIEFILVLDRCTNTEFQKAIEISPPNIEVKVINSVFPGIVPALNLGIAEAKYELIARLDSDDTVTPERFLKQVKYLDRVKEVVCVGTQLNFIDEKGIEFGYTNYPIGHADILKRMKYQNCIGHPSVMFRKSIVQQIGGYREFLTGSEDYDLWLRLSEIGSLSNLPMKLTNYRVSRFQFTNQIKLTQPLTESACRISAAMRRLKIIENLPRKNESLSEYNLRNFFEIKLLNPKIAGELHAAAYLNGAYREWSEPASINRRFVKVVQNILRAGWFSPRLVISFFLGRIRFHSVRDQA